MTITNNILNINKIIGSKKEGLHYSIQENNEIYFDISPIDYITDPRKFIYRFDFGDGWEYSIGNSNIEYKTKQSGTIKLKIEFIDRDMNISETKEIKLKVLRPWYFRTNIAIPLYGGTLILLITTSYSLFKYFRKRRHVEYLKEKDMGIFIISLLEA